MVLAPLTKPIDLKHNDHTQKQTFELFMLKLVDSKLNQRCKIEKETKKTIVKKQA